MSTNQEPGSIPDEPHLQPPGANDGAPVDPLSAMGAQAVVMHEIYSSLVGAGFNDCQSCYLCGVLLAETMRKAP